MAVICCTVLAQGVFLLVEPDYKKGEYTMIYKVYYPNNTKIHTIKNELPISLCSSRGTNYITKTEEARPFKKIYGIEYVIKTSVLIEAISYTYREK